MSEHTLAWIGGDRSYHCQHSNLLPMLTSMSTSSFTRPLSNCGDFFGSLRGAHEIQEGKGMSQVQTLKLWYYTWYAGYIFASNNPI
jgi:hypothetical protein